MYTGRWLGQQLNIAANQKYNDTRVNHGTMHDADVKLANRNRLFNSGIDVYW